VLYNRQEQQSEGTTTRKPTSWSDYYQCVPDGTFQQNRIIRFRYLLTLHRHALLAHLQFLSRAISAPRSRLASGKLPAGLAESACGVVLAKAVARFGVMT
jgi:hypothetical protein